MSSLHIVEFIDRRFRAILTVDSFGFGPGGANLPCVSQSIDAASIYPANYSKTDAVKTFMQTDAASINLGTVCNTGWTFKQEKYKAPQDDQFNMRVGVKVEIKRKFYLSLSYECIFSPGL